MVPTLIVFFTLPFALLGGFFYVDILGFNMSIAIIVGFMALLGVAAETAIVMIVYLKESVEEAQTKYGVGFNEKYLNEAIYEGAGTESTSKAYDCLCHFGRIVTYYVYTWGWF